MKRRRSCRTCQGVYFSEDADGVLYFHACPPSGEDAAGNPIERANKRDENIDVDAERRARGIKRAGAGADDV